MNRFNLDTKGKLAKMNSEALLRKISLGNLSKTHAKIAASIIEKRFPTPKN